MRSLGAHKRWNHSVYAEARFLGVERPSVGKVRNSSHSMISRFRVPSSTGVSSASEPSEHGGDDEGVDTLKTELRMVARAARSFLRRGLHSAVAAVCQRDHVTLAASDDGE
jgi:hypothetical protein